MFDLATIWAWVQANPLIVLVVAYLFFTKKLTLASILAFFTGGKTPDDFLKKLLEQLLAAKAAKDQDAEAAILKTIDHCIHCEKK